jgi:predicted nucleic acid-binding protein
LNFLLDTNVACEQLRKLPDATVIEWISRQRSERLFVSTIALAEIQFGIGILEPSRRRAALEDWLVDFRESLGERLLPLDQEVAVAWGNLRAAAKRAGRPIPFMDAFVAATAEVHRLTVVTRNIRDFEVWGGPVFNPCDEDPPA